MFLGICIDQSISDRLDFPPPLVKDATKVDLERFQGGDTMMPGLIPDKVILDALVANMVSHAVDFNGQGVSGEAVMEDV